MKKLLLGIILTLPLATSAAIVKVPNDIKYMTPSYPFYRGSDKVHWYTYLDTLTTQDILYIGCKDQPTNNMFHVIVKSKELVNVMVTNITPTFKPAFVASGTRSKVFTHSSWSQIRGVDNLMRVIINRVNKPTVTQPRTSYSLAARCGEIMIYSVIHHCCSLPTQYAIYS